MGLTSSRRYDRTRSATLSRVVPRCVRVQWPTASFECLHSSLSLSLSLSTTSGLSHRPPFVSGRARRANPLEPAALRTLALARLPATGVSTIAACHLTPPPAAGQGLPPRPSTDERSHEHSCPPHSYPPNPTHCWPLRLRLCYDSIRLQSTKREGSHGKHSR